MQSWELFATLGTTLAAWGAMLGLMWRMHTSLRKDLGGQIASLRGDITGVRDQLRAEIAGVRDELRGEIAGVRTDLGGEIGELRDTLSARLAINENVLVGVSEDLAEFRGEMRGELKGVNRALLVLREDFRAHVHGVRAG